MREFFEALDAGQYDPLVLMAFVVLTIGAWALQRWADRRADRRLARIQSRTAFYDAQRRAQEAFERYGGHDSRTQQEVIGALVCWQRWTDKPVPFEEEAAQLMRVLDAGEEQAASVM